MSAGEKEHEMQGYSSSDLKAPVFGAELANGSPNFGALQTLMIQRQRPQRTSIYDLDHESVVIVLQYLRATDLCSVSETDRSVFNQLHLQKAAIYQITHIYNVFTASITNPDMFKDKDRDSDRDRDSSSNYSSTPPKLSHSMSSPPAPNSAASTGSLGIAYSTPHKDKDKDNYKDSYNFKESSYKEKESLSVSSSGSKSARPPRIRKDRGNSLGSSPSSPPDEATWMAMAGLKQSQSQSQSLNMPAPVSAPVDSTGKIYAVRKSPHPVPQQHSSYFSSPLPTFVTGGTQIDVLYFREVKCLLQALHAAQPLLNLGTQGGDASSTSGEIPSTSTISASAVSPSTPPLFGSSWSTSSTPTPASTAINTSNANSSITTHTNTHVKAFWVSQTWVANARKYHEALALPDLQHTAGTRTGDSGGIITEFSLYLSSLRRSTYDSDSDGAGTFFKRSSTSSTPGKNSKSSRIRARRGSDALPPWPAINADIVCQHGNLSLLKNPKAKRRLVSPQVWYFLRRFYPLGPTYKATGKSRTNECPLCFSQVEGDKLSVQQQKERELRRRADAVPEELMACLGRKSGVPATHIRREDRSGTGASSGASCNPTNNPINGGTNSAGGSHSLSQSHSSSPSSSYDGQGGMLASGGVEEYLGHNQAPSQGFSSILGIPSAPVANADSAGAAAAAAIFPTEVNCLTCTLLNAIDGVVCRACQEPLPALPEGYEDVREALASADTLQMQCPLLPGQYNIVPREWLKAWRTYTRDVRLSTPMPPQEIDCGMLLCQSHSQLVVPPHLEEYLSGLAAVRGRRGPVSGLGGYTGDIVEILSAEEWELLQGQVRSHKQGLNEDFGISFSVDEDGTAVFSVGVCSSCDPFTHNLLRKDAGKKKPNHQNNLNANKMLHSLNSALNSGIGSSSPAALSTSGTLTASAAASNHLDLSSRGLALGLSGSGGRTRSGSGDYSDSVSVPVNASEGESDEFAIAIKYAPTSSGSVFNLGLEVENAVAVGSSVVVGASSSGSSIASNASGGRKAVASDTNNSEEGSEGAAGGEFLYELPGGGFETYTIPSHTSTSTSIDMQFAMEDSEEAFPSLGGNSVLGGSLSKSSSKGELAQAGANTNANANTSASANTNNVASTEVAGTGADASVWDVGRAGPWTPTVEF